MLTSLVLRSFFLRFSVFRQNVFAVRWRLFKLQWKFSIKGLKQVNVSAAFWLHNKFQSEFLVENLQELNTASACESSLWRHKQTCTWRHHDVRSCQGSKREIITGCAVNQTQQTQSHGLSDGHRGFKAADVWMFSSCRVWAASVGWRFEMKKSKKKKDWWRDFHSDECDEDKWKKDSGSWVIYWTRMIHVIDDASLQLICDKWKRKEQQRFLQLEEPRMKLQIKSSLMSTKQLWKIWVNK